MNNELCLVMNVRRFTKILFLICCLCHINTMVNVACAISIRKIVYDLINYGNYFSMKLSPEFPTKAV